MKNILVTGGAGFIGSNFILDWFKCEDEEIINIDSLTYAGNLENLSLLKDNELYKFKHGDIKDPNFIEEILVSFNPRAIINFAAESHVDRSILNPYSVGDFEKDAIKKLDDFQKIIWEKYIWVFIHIFY